MKEVLSLGAGVQSSTVFMMSCLGELPKLDGAIFADTGWEPASVYKYLDWLREQGERYGIPVYQVKTTNIRKDAINAMAGGDETKKFGISMPLHIIGQGGKKGIVKRQCTTHYKIKPIHKFLREKFLGLKKGQRAPKELSIRVWMGISSDEMLRIKNPKHVWMSHYYPLCNMETFADGKFEKYDGSIVPRGKCIEWFREKGYPTPPRSACIGCPYRSDAEWKKMKEEEPEAFQDAIQFDQALRAKIQKRMYGHLYLHSSAKPLDEVDLESQEDKGQLDLFQNDCEGMCGV